LRAHSDNPGRTPIKSGVARVFRQAREALLRLD
jgi:hypothetical protein